MCLKTDLLVRHVELNPGFIYHHSFVGRRSGGGWHLKWTGLSLLDVPSEIRSCPVVIWSFSRKKDLFPHLRI